MTTPTLPTGNDALMNGGGSGRSVSFGPVGAAPGASITGTVVETPRLVQQKKFGSDEAELWPNGDPKMQVLITLQTALQEDAEDDGRRALYVKMGNKEGAMQRVIREAVQAAGGKGVEAGGTLTVTYVADGPKPASGFPPRLFSATYEPPAAGNDALMAPSPVAAVPSPAPAAAPPASTPPAPTAPPKNSPVTTARALLDSGMADPQVAELTGLTLEVVAALRSQGAA